MDNQQDSNDLKSRILQETARIPFRELQRFFANGTLWVVSNHLDLVDVALQIARDNKSTVEKWMTKGELARASDDQAKAWVEDDASLWAVVLKPWVLVQEKKGNNPG